MARQPLIHVPNGIYSVTSKCNNNEFHFNADEKFRMYIRHLINCKEKLGFELYDIVCMSNHVHELYRVPEDITISDILHRVKGHFSQRYNKRFHRKHHFWRNRSFCRIVENEEYGFHVMNYFHWNPVRAGMVSHPAQWPYSGYRFHMLNERDGIIGHLLSQLPGIDLSEELLKSRPKLEQEIRRILKNEHTIFIGKDTLII